MADNAHGTRHSQLRLATITLLLPLYVSVAFGVNFFGALHAPRPHDVSVAIVGAPAETATVARELSVAPNNGFDVSRMTSVAAARRLVAARKLAGAYVPSAAPPTVIVAVAASASLAEFVEGTFGQLTARRGRPLNVEDVRPLPPGNANGIPNFFFLVICSLGGFLAVAALGVMAPGLPWSRRIAVAAAASVVTPTSAYLIGGPGFGEFGGDFGTVMAVVGIGTLYTFAVACTTWLFQRAFGMPGTLPASLIVIFLNLPSSGGTVAAPLMPGFWRFLNHFWIGAAGLEANQSVLYFGGAGIGDDVLKMLAWLAGWAIVLALPIYRRGMRRRRAVAETTPSPALRVV
jgi:hypothetical protein